MQSLDTDSRDLMDVIRIEVAGFWGLGCSADERAVVECASSIGGIRPREKSFELPGLSSCYRLLRSSGVLQSNEFPTQASGVTTMHALF